MVGGYHSGAPQATGNGAGGAAMEQRHCHDVVPASALRKWGRTDWLLTDADGALQDSGVLDPAYRDREASRTAGALNGWRYATARSKVESVTKDELASLRSARDRSKAAPCPASSRTSALVEVKA